METLIKTSTPAERPVALVTGGAIRVGRAISAHLGGLGYTVVVHYNSSAEAATSLASQFETLGSTAILHRADFARPRSAGELIDAVIDQTGRLDLLVNSAAIYAEDDADLKTLARMKLVNYDAPVALIDKATVYLKRTGGSVVNIADAAGAAPFENAKIYSKTKAAILNITYKNAKQLIDLGVRVNAVSPGTVLFTEHFCEEQKKRIIDKIPMGRCGTSKDVAEAVAYLATASYVTGQVIAVDGGLHLF